MTEAFETLGGVSEVTLQINMKTVMEWADEPDTFQGQLIISLHICPRFWFKVHLVLEDVQIQREK